MVEEIPRVRQCSDALVAHLRLIEPEINAVYQPNAQSKAIQGLVNDWLVDRGFVAEYLEALAEVPTTPSRREFFLDLGGGRGLLVEVERGERSQFALT